MKEGDIVTFRGEDRQYIVLEVSDGKAKVRHHREIIMNVPLWELEKKEL